MPSASSPWEQLHALRHQLPNDAQAYDNILKSLVTSLKKLLSQKSPAGNTADEATIDHLDPYLDTIPFLYILDEHIESAGKKAETLLRPGSTLWNKLVRLLLGLNSVEARYAGRQWARLVIVLCKTYRLAPLERQQPCLELAGKALLLYDPSGVTLTRLHIYLIEACLDTRQFSQALEILGQPITRFATKTSFGSDIPLCAAHLHSEGDIYEGIETVGGIEMADVQQYFLMAAMVFIGLRQWTSAASFLESVIYVPSDGTANGPMVEAYKKWILVCILASDRVRGQVKVSNEATMKILKLLSGPYEAIADSFKRDDGAKLAAEAHEAADKYTEDGNLSLVQRVLTHHKKLKISGLENIYSHVPVSLVAKKFSMTNTEALAYLQELINSRSISAVLEQGTQSDPLLKFTSPAPNVPGTESEMQMRALLLQKTRSINALQAQVLETDRRLALTSEFLDHERNSRKSKQAAGDAPDITLGGPGSDEDDEKSMKDD